MLGDAFLFAMLSIICFLFVVPYPFVVASITFAALAALRLGQHFWISSGRR